MGELVYNCISTDDTVDTDGGDYLLSLNYHDPRPIYEQLKEGLRRLILTGGMAAGERLPSVRELSAQLAVNPNTIQRAYRELEAEGFICTVQGKGSFAAPLSEVRDDRRIKLLTQFSEIAAELLRLGESTDTLIARIEKEAHHD